MDSDLNDEPSATIGAPPSAPPGRTGGRRGIPMLMLEGAIVAVGVFLSLWADQFREDRNVARDAEASLARIAEDLRRDVELLEFVAETEDRGAAAIRITLGSGPEGLPHDSIETLIPWIILSNLYRPGGSEFASLQSAGRLGIIRDQELISRLASYYNMLQTVGDRLEMDLSKSHEVAELLYPHVLFPPDQFIRADWTRATSLFPNPTVSPSFDALWTDPVFVNEMTYLGVLKETATVSIRSAIEVARDLADGLDTEAREE